MIVVPSLHPAYLLRSSDGEKGEARFKDTVINDFKKAIAYKRRRPHWDERVIWETRPAIPGKYGGDPNDDKALRYANLFPTAKEVEDFLASVHKTLLAIDIETSGEHAFDCKLICVGIASSNGKALCIPILSQGGRPYWDGVDGPRVAKALAWILANKQTPKVFHNGAFDTIVLKSLGYPVEGFDEDTMLAHHCVDGELPHGLDYCASRYLEIPYYKGDVKGDTKWIDLPDVTLRSYNLRDCLTTLLILPPLKAELEKWGLVKLYREEIQIAKIMAYATERGLTIDKSRRYWIYRVLKQQRETAYRKLVELSGDPEFKPQGPRLIKLLFETLKFPIVERTEKDQPSTNKQAITKLALFAKTKEQKAALKALIRFRKVDKLIGTYTGDFAEDGSPGSRRGIYTIAHEDGFDRVHATWKLLVVTGRLASSPNMQNLPERIKAMFRARAGYELSAVDLQQAELRGIAYYSNDQILLEAYKRGLDVHTINTAMLLGIRSPGPNTNPETEAYLEETFARSGKVYAELPVAPKDRWKGIRRQAKGFVFADNYDAQAETIYEVLKSERDKETDELVFPHLTLGDVEANKATWEELHPWLKDYWRECVDTVAEQGFLRCELSGRIRWFRGGPKKNEVVNFLIQTLVAAHMNKATIRINERLTSETQHPDFDRAAIVVQVHDQLVVEHAPWCRQIVHGILKEELSRSFHLRQFPEAILPPDKVENGTYLNEV